MTSETYNGDCQMKVELKGKILVVQERLNSHGDQLDKYKKHLNSITKIIKKLEAKIVHRVPSMALALCFDF